MKKKIIGLLAGFTLLALSACGGGESGAAAGSKDYIYRGEEVALDEVEDMNGIGNFILKNDRMYIICYNWAEEGATLNLISKNTDGSDGKTAELKTGNNASYSLWAVDEEENYYAVLNEYMYDDSNPDNIIQENNYFLVKLDAQGKELWKRPLNEKKEEDYWVQWMKLLTDGQLIMKDNKGVYIYDKDGNPVRELKLNCEPDEYAEAYQMQDGSLVLGTYSSETNKTAYSRLNTQTGELSEAYSIPGNSNAYSVYPGAGYDFLLVGSGSIYGYNLGDTETKKLMNFVDSDLNAGYIYNVTAVSETEFYGMISDDLDGRTVLLKFTKVDPKDVKDKKIITLACNGLNWNVRRQVVAFNKSNPDYRIQIQDYYEYNTEEDFTAGLTRLNTDIASGKVPDILIGDYRMPTESYASKGLFEDLYPFIDNDAEMSREDFFPNVLAAYETDGKLYHLVPQFTIHTVSGKTSEVGKETGWTLDELEALMETKPEEMQVFAETTRDTMLNCIIQVSGHQFINWSSGECNFNSKGFIDLLEFVKDFPEELGEDYYNDKFWQEYEVMWREGKVLLNMTYLDSFATYNHIKKVVFGEDITLIGFPAENRKGSAINPQLDIMMSSKSKHKEGCWQFMRYFLTDEYQEKQEYGWPLSLKQVDKLAEAAKKKPQYEDENGNMVEYEQKYTVGGVELTVTPMTQEEIDEVLAFVKSVDQVYSYDESLLNIITEEAAPFFAGQKSAKEVADIIQSRVQIYVNENR